jgi:hypothetical protein
VYVVMLSSEQHLLHMVAGLGKANTTTPELAQASKQTMHACVVRQASRWVGGWGGGGYTYEGVASPVSFRPVMLGM